jgi:uncharacterized protein (DUF3084 family)
VEQLTEGKVDFKNRLHVWLFIIWKSHELQKTPGEVVDMYAQLQEIVNNDPGLLQYVDRVSSISVDPKAIREYNNWFQEYYSHQGEIEGAVDDRDAYWQTVVEEKDAAIKGKDAVIEEKDAAIEEKDAAIEEKDAAIKEKDAEIARLRALYADK